jgi:hypothetical protein
MGMLVVRVAVVAVIFLLPWLVERDRPNLRLLC